MRKHIMVLAFVAIVLAVAVFMGLSFFSQTDLQPDQPNIERTAIVSYVVDGDTIRLQDDERVRLVGVNTPELDSEDPIEQANAERAKEFVEGLCPPDTEVGLDVDDLEPNDHYGRTLAVVYVSVDNIWTNLNAELLRRGLAEIMYIPPSEFNPYKWSD